MSLRAASAAAGPAFPVSEGQFAFGALVLAAAAGPGIALTGAAGVAALAAGVTFVAIGARPQLGGYLYMLATPLIVGIGRGDLLPLIRPNEALLLIIAAALATRIVLVVAGGGRYRPEFTRTDLALALLATTGSIMPLLLAYGRGQAISTDDILWSIVLWKYVLVCRVFREAVTTPAQVAVCLWLSLASAAIVSLVAVLQVFDLLGVAGFLHTYYDDPFEGGVGAVTDRGTSTVAHSLGVADIMAMNLAIVIAWLPYRRRVRAVLLLAAGACLLGCIAAGQASGLIGLVVAIMAVGVVTGRLSRLLAATVPAAGVAALALSPVIVQRLNEVDPLAGLPESWVGRLDNLRQFIFPELFSGFNWLLGVRPAARVLAPESWRTWIYIESGYVWLLWTGGIPMLIAFGYFLWVGLHELRAVIAERADAVGIAAIAAFAGLVSMAVLMLFDPHLTMRGGADLLFPLLALSFVTARPQARGRAQRE